MGSLQVIERDDSIQICRISENILNKKLRRANMDRFCGLGLEESINAYLKNQNFWKCYTATCN
jgi:hypothetical protein